MTISNSSRTAGPFIGTGTTNSFPFSFKVFSRSDLLVATTNTSTGIETVLVLDSDYAVTLNADQTTNPGGIVTTTTNLATGYTLAMTTNIAITQNLDLTNNGGFYPKAISDALDRIVVQIQQLAAKISGGLNIGAAATIQTVATLVTGAGASVVGFLQSGIGAILRTVQDELRERVKITQFGAATGNTAAQNGTAIRAAMVEAAARKGVLWVPAGVYQFDYFPPATDVTIDGEGVLQQVQTGGTQSGITKPSGSGPLSNFHVRNIGFDGARVANPGYVFNAIASFEVGPGETITNISFQNCRFQDAQDHFIRIVATDATGLVQQVRVDRCSFITTAAKRSLGGTADVVSFDGVRFEQTWDYTTGGNGYGAAPNFKHIWVTNCYAESIRTLADIKRGCSHFTVAKNKTKNMYDCHHSVDGSFYGSIIKNTCEVEASYTGPSNFNDFIEVQGEHIIIASNTGTGGGKVLSGIFITDYGRTQESGVGHRSVNVLMIGNTIKDITGNAYRILNGVGCATRSNHCENVGGHVATIESGTGRTDGTNPLVAIGCAVAGVNSKNATLGVKIQGSGHVKGFNPDENGQDYFYAPGFALASTYGNFINEGGYVNLNPNSLLAFTGSSANNVNYTDSDFYPAATAAATRPNGAAAATTLTDESAVAMRVIYFSTHVPVSQNERIYVRVFVKKNTAINCGVVIQEYDSSGTFLSNSFAGAAVPTSWTDYIVAYKVTNANAAYIRVGLLPANSSNSVTETGATDFAKCEFSRMAIGR